MDYRNYGNRLQNYALKELFQEEGWESLSGLIVYSKEDWAATSTGIRNIAKRLMPFSLYKIRTKWVIQQNATKHEKDLRRKALACFTEKNIAVLPVFIVKDGQHLFKLLNAYRFDYYVVGSDQVWNPIFGGRDYEFLTFAPKDKRLSFAASFGVDTIPDTLTARFQSNLKELHYISVREAQGVKLAEKLTKREDIDLTLDPTLLLPREKWETLLCNCTLNKPVEYIATYFLGSIPEAVLEFAKNQGLPILALNNKEDDTLYNIDPIGFLSVIHDAAYVLTDSFHGMAFSIKFHREFYVFRRSESPTEGNMFSRLEDLLDALQLTDRIQRYSKVTLSDSISQIRWKSIDDYLSLQKEYSMKRLKQNM